MSKYTIINSSVLLLISLCYSGCSPRDNSEGPAQAELRVSYGSHSIIIDHQEVRHSIRRELIMAGFEMGREMLSDHIRYFISDNKFPIALSDLKGLFSERRWKDDFELNLIPTKMVNHGEDMMVPLSLRLKTSESDEYITIIFADGIDNVGIYDYLSGSAEANDILGNTIITGILIHSGGQQKGTLP